MARKLKVYRTPIGFHDAYVAAPNQKAALKAWGSDADLFARGVAELVTDAALTADPLAHPGEVIRVRRGSAAENVAALPKAAKRPAKRASAPIDDDEGPPPRPRGRPAARSEKEDEAAPRTKPRRSPTLPGPSAPARKARGKRPSRARLERAEAALADAETKHREIVAALRERERAVQRERRDLETKHEAEIGRLEGRIAKERDAYSEALRAWRG